MRLHPFLNIWTLISVTTAQACTIDEGCSLNGVCRAKACRCDPGWYGSDCGHLDLRPALKNNGYNHSADGVASSHLGNYGNSSWGGTIIQDRQDPAIFHLIASQFADGCGLSGWRPFSFIFRAESRSGPQGPYHYADTVSKPFRHNPQVVWSPADEKYLLYTIGADDNENRTKCSSISYTRWPNNISVSTAQDIRGPWSEFELILASEEPHSTNPSPFPLRAADHPTSAIALAVEDLAIFEGDSYEGPYNLLHTQTWNTTEYSPTWTEDSFLWRDKRGNWHALAHWMIDLVEHDGQKWPRVGAHMFARHLEGPWHWHMHEAFNSTVTYTDGTVQTLQRRERAKIFFSDDGEMTPLYLVNGVQEMGEGSRSSTFIQPIGEKWETLEEALGF